MKKKILFFILISFVKIHSQIVDIPDNNFKNHLLNASYSHSIAFDINYNRVPIDTNNDGEIQINEAQNIYYLIANSLSISDLTGIESFVNLLKLNCVSNLITNLDLSENLNLEELIVHNNELTNLNVSNSVNLTKLICLNNQLTNLNVSNNVNLIELDFWSNQLTNINLSQNTNLEILNCNNNPLTYLYLGNNINLTHLYCAYNQYLNYLDLSNNSNFRYLNCNDNQFFEINLKNGNNDAIYFVGLTNSPNLQRVCVDDVSSNLVNEINSDVFDHTVIFSDSYDCSFLNTNKIIGNINFNLNNNSCDLPISNIMLLSNNGIDNFTTFSHNNGNYLQYTNEGNFITEVTTNLPSYFTANPSSQTNTFTGFNNTFTTDFCIESNQTVNDVNISLIPIIPARPDFDATYQIVYKNIGTTQLNGNVTLEFDDIKLSFLNASEIVNVQTSNSLTFNYANINPFETRTIDLEFNVLAPPTVEIDDVLSFTATINPIAGDFTANDNIFTLNQTVVGSFDPNDITVLEGNQILLADTEKYLHYIIRFQNTGTANAINVVVKNELDTNLDWSTLQLESLSHNNRIAIKNGNEIEFIFENINLPDSTTDELNSHGFIAYKIKPKTDIALGDIITNKADIFFDFNAPIETNTATTTIVNALSVNENTLLDFSVYPTPTENILNIKSKTEIVKIEIYSKLGQLIKETTENKVDISNLTQGLYFVKIEDVNGNFGVKKIVKK